MPLTQKTTKITEVFAALKQIFNILSRPLWMNPTNGRVRVDIENSASIATTISSGTVTTLTQIGGIVAFDSLMMMPMKETWALCVRRNIS